MMVDSLCTEESDPVEVQGSVNPDYLTVPARHFQNRGPIVVHGPSVFKASKIFA